MSEIVSIMKEILFSRGGRIFSVIGSLFAVFILLHASSFWSSGIKLVDQESFVHSWEISFSESILSESENVLIGDEETYDFEYYSDVDTLSNRMVAAFQITVSYDETSGGAANPCDSVTATIQPSEMSAQWTNESTQISGNSDDCSDIVMLLMVYPDYNSQPKNETGIKEDEVLAKWKIQEYGLGSLVCRVSVDATDSPVSNLPLTSSDEGEEVMVSWERIEFYPNATMIE
ncbi:MAG: hypothetical protein ACJZ67_03170 [Candidatus Thalassarchaeaceae archaeon]